jgi:hypothetical protein
MTTNINKINVILHVVPEMETSLAKIRSFEATWHDVNPKVSSASPAACSICAASAAVVRWEQQSLSTP